MENLSVAANKNELKEAKAIINKLIAAQTLPELLKSRNMAIELYGYNNPECKELK